MANPIDISKHFPDEQPSNPFAARIRAECARQKVTIEQLAQRMEFAPEHVLKVYNGEMLPSPTFFRKVCAALNLDEDEMAHLFMRLQAQRVEASIQQLLDSGDDLSSYPLLSQIKKPKAN